MLKYFLGMEFARSKEGIFVNQHKYVLDLLKETGMTGCKAANTPIEPNVKLKIAAANEVMDKARYQRLVGRLIYLAHTRPDIAFAVNLLARFSSAPTKRHWNGVKHVLRYLQGTIDLGLFYPNNTKPVLIGYADAGYMSNPHKGRSQTGYVFTC